MNEYPRSIVVAVDFGEASGRATAVAGALAAAWGTTLRLLHAETCDAPPYFTLDQVDQLREEATVSRRRVEHAVAAFGHRHTSCPFDVDIAEERPADAILRAPADLVVMGTHGRRGPSRWWLGSVAERVLKQATTPLLIVHAGDAVSTADECRTVVVHASPPLRGDATLAYVSRLFAAYASTIADARGVPLSALATAPGTLIATACPVPRTADWLASIGEPLLTLCSRPVLFVPESPTGVEVS
jgi:nucleotide-binding universal stress UspA family protein